MSVRLVTEDEAPPPPYTRLDQILSTLAGAASTCWIEQGGHRIFDSTRATALCQEAAREIRAYIASETDPA